MLETTCRSRGGTDLVPVLSLGRTLLANSLLTAAELARPEQVFPLDVVFCQDCSLVQITETVPPEELFSDYVYLSAPTPTATSGLATASTSASAHHWPAWRPVSPSKPLFRRYPDLRLALPAEEVCWRQDLIRGFAAIPLRY